MAENIALLRIVSYFSYSSNHKYFQSNIQRTQIIDKKWMPSSSFLFRYFFLNIYIYIFHPRIYHALRTRTLWRNFSTLKLNLQRKICISSHCLEHALSFTPRSFVNRKKSNLSPTVSYLFFFVIDPVYEDARSFSCLHHSWKKIFRRGIGSKIGTF